MAVYFTWDGSQRVVAVDRYATPEANVRAIFMIIEGRRQEMRYGGLHMVRSSFVGLRLLAGPVDWRSVLELSPGADLSAAEVSYRRLVRELHPDRPGGSIEAFQRLQEALEAARAHLGPPTRAAE